MSELDALIPPEICNDEFSRWITKLVKEHKPKTILEIGSSAGAGSTAAFVDAIQSLEDKPLLFCLELSLPRFEALKSRYAGCSFVTCLWASSVTLEDFPTPADVTNFYYSHSTNLNSYPLARVLGWLEQDRQYLMQSGAQQDGIEIVKQNYGITAFDLVLIDGSEFLGEAELNRVIGAELILLDDVNAHKNYNSRQRLLKDGCYRMLHENVSCRNGYSIFQRV